MDVTLSLFPKFFQDLAPADLASRVRDLGLDACNAVIRDGFWCRPRHLAEDLPRFAAAMREGGVSVPFATTPYTAEELVADDTPLRVLADHGITAFRFAHLNGEDPAATVEAARPVFAELAARCARLGLRAQYQLHHHTAVASPSMAWYLVKDCDPAGLGVMLDPGNQCHDGHEVLPRSLALLGAHLGAWGIKDARWWRDDDHAHMPDKGWRLEWCRLEHGIVNWHAVGELCHRIDFRGTMVFMPFYHQDDAAALTEALAADVAYLRAALRA